jgi:DNA adenine methylase
MTEVAAQPEMKIGAIAPYFGGKRTLAPIIVHELGKHTAYWEPFCGSMAVLMAKAASRSETVNDLHGDIVNLARVLASDRAPDLYDRLSRTMFCESLYLEIRRRRKESATADEVDAAYCFFVESWMGKNGVAGTREANTAFCRRYTTNGGDPATRFRNAVESIPAWHQRLRSVQIYQADGIGIIERIEDKVGTVVYADPPYLVKGSAYRHDFADGFLDQPNDHERLAAALCRFKRTRVVVSYYDHAALSAMYRGWTVRPVHITKALVSQGRRDVDNKVVAPEVLLINGPSLAADAAGRANGATR